MARRQPRAKVTVTRHLLSRRYTIVPQAAGTGTQARGSARGMAAKRTIGRSNLKNRRAGTHRAKLKIGRYTTSIRWVPDLHPRGPGGRFIKKG